MRGGVDEDISKVSGGKRMTKEEFHQSMEYDTLRYSNMRIIKKNNDCQVKIRELKAIEQFVSDFSFLSFGRAFILCRNHTLSLQMIVSSLELTAGNIISCCEVGCLADAHLLLRKYRDDMFFYLYLILYDTNKKLDLSYQSTNKMEDNIERWIKNDLSDLQIGTVLKAIAQSPATKEAVEKYSLHTYFNQLSSRLNNYVHSNGIKYYNCNVMAYQDNELQERLNSLLMDMRFITITFLFLLTVCAPHFIMSNDYVDFLDENITPPEDSHYWVAPFIVDFFRENIKLIDKSCIDYLQNNTPMKFD